ncbi:MAG TPA: glycoside hydrolase family 27 protein [Gemmatimonadaceae bacterium]|nr:glycoside hydrolase family 27 protein [Gemmatimonadaceae bacterium]
MRIDSRVALALIPLLFGAALTPPASNRIALTPPMGWNSWNHFGCNVSDALIRSTADAMVSSGMRAAGYQYVVIDDCWQVSRDLKGTIVADSSRFPRGIKALADYVHSKGLRFGIYTDAGTKTCQGRPGTYGYEDQDARTYAAWGVDYVKEDWCNASGLNAPAQYAKFRKALDKSGRAIVLSICEWGSNQPWDWAPGIGHLWRTTDDIEDKWTSMLANLDQSSQHSTVARPGAWNDPDMLEVGNGGMTDDEYRAHMSLWAIQAAPLIAGNDLRTMSEATRVILTNPEVLAVDQDSLGAQGILVWEPVPELQVWAKRLRNGTHAVVLLNRSAKADTINAYLSRVGIHSDSASVRDLWSHGEIGKVKGTFSAFVKSHSAMMVRMAAIGKAP